MRGSEWQITDLDMVAERIAKWREGKGFYTPNNLISYERRDLMLGKLMLVVSEVAEAAEAVRNGDLENFQEEIADTMIRLLDISGTMKLDLQGTVVRKMLRNEKREPRHGKQTNL